MANLGKIDYSEIDKYISSPLPKLGEVNLSPKMDNVTPSETSRPKLAAPIDYSKYEDKPFYDDAQAVAKSIGKGAMVNLPEMAGQAAQALSTEGSAVSNWGKGVVESAKTRAKDWQVDMAGRGTVAKSLIEGGEMIAPSIATLPAYLAGPMAGAAATVALYGGSSYQDVYERSKAAGLSDSDAHKAGLMEGAIEAGGELISNKLSLGLLGAGKKAGMAAVTSGTLDQSVLKPFGKAFAKEAVGEQLTEGFQNYGQSKVEGAYGLSKEKGLGESFSETFGPTLGMSVLLSPFGLAGHYVSSKSNQEKNERAQAIQHILDSPESGNKMDRRRVVEMLHSDALKAGVDPKEASAWKAQAIIDIANNQPIYRGEVEAEKDLPDTSDKANKDLLPTGERLQNKDLFKTYSKFDNLYKLHDDPNSPDYQSGYQAITSSLSSLINPEEGEAVDPVKQDEARKVLKLVEDANAVKTRQFNRQLEADKAAAQIDQEEVSKEANEPDSSIDQTSQEDTTQIDPEVLKRLMDEDTEFNEPIDTESTDIPQEPIEPIDTTESDTPVSAPVSRTDEVISQLNQRDVQDTSTLEAPKETVIPESKVEVPIVPADSSQVEAAQAEAVSKPVQPVVQEDKEAYMELYHGTSAINKAKILSDKGFKPGERFYDYSQLGADTVYFTSKNGWWLDKEKASSGRAQVYSDTVKASIPKDKVYTVNSDEDIDLLAKKIGLPSGADLIKGLSVDGLTDTIEAVKNPSVVKSKLLTQRLIKKGISAIHVTEKYQGEWANDQVAVLEPSLVKPIASDEEFNKAPEEFKRLTLVKAKEELDYIDGGFLDDLKEQFNTAENLDEWTKEEQEDRKEYYKKLIKEYSNKREALVKLLETNTDSSVVQEEVKAPIASKEVKTVKPKTKTTKPKAPKETKIKPELIGKEGDEIKLDLSSITDRFPDIIRNRTTDFKNMDVRIVSIRPNGVKIAVPMYNHLGEPLDTVYQTTISRKLIEKSDTPAQRIKNVSSSNSEVSESKVAVEQGSEDPEVIQNSQEPIQSLEPKDASRIDDVLAELEDLRDQLEVAEIEDRKEIRSSIKELEATLKELGYAERQSKVKFTTSEDSESAKDEEDEWTHETKDDVLGFTLDDNGEERFDGKPDWLTDTSKTLAQIKKNQAINKRSFDKFLNNISPAIKKEVVFKFIPDFRDADLSSEGLSDNAETTRGVYKVINGVPHIFVNGAIDPEDFAGTFIHEVVGHFGVRKLFDRFDKDRSSSLSNYDKFLVNLINNNSFFRSQIINRFSNWSNYESNFIKRNRKEGETTDQMYSRLQSEYKGTGNVVLEFTVDMPTGKEKRKIPVEVAVQLADEHIAELAKELYFDKKFIEKEVGLGVSTDSIRASKSAQFKSFMKMVFDKIRHYMRSIFGEYVNTLTQDDLNRMVAASFSNIFHIVDSEMLKTYESSEVTPRRTVKKKYIVNNSGYNVSIGQSNESTRYDQDMGLEENEITNPFLLADIPELSKFIDLTISGFGNHNDTIRSDVWKKLQEKINDNPLLSSLKALGNMPFQEAYTAIQNVYKGQIAKVESTVKDMASVLEGLNASTNDAIFEYMTNPNQDVTLLNITSRQQEVVKNAKDAINELGRVSMELGLIPEESYNRNKDAYLHTMYLKYLDQYRGSGKSTSLLSWMKAKKKLNARERAALGEIKDVKFLIAETLGVISRDHVLINMFNTVAKSSNRNGLYWTLTNEDKIKLPWDNRKVATIDKAYKLVDDMAFIISESKGENKVTFDGKESTIANLVKDREEIISRINALENKALEEAHKHALDSGFTTHEDQHEFLRNHYVRMPNTARYGLLRNQWVRKEIYNDLDVLTASYDLSNKDNIEKFFARGGTLEKINRLWKMSMVALNPGSWIRNIAGNFTLLDLSTSTSSTKLIGMLHSEIMKTMGDKKPSEFWKLAEEYGLFGTTFSAVELQDMYSKYGDELEAARALYEAREGSSWEKSIPLFDNRFIAIGKMLAKGKDLGHRTTATTSKAYAFVEGAFKTVSFKDYILTWESQNQQEFPGGWKSLDETQQRALFAKAAAHANEALFDYSQVPSAIKTLRRIPFGAPFLTFSYKAGPASVRAMINHPVKFAKYATLPALLTMIAMATNDWDDKDIAHFKARLPEYYRNNPGIAFLPFKDSLGRPQILPLDYLLPWSQWTTASRKVYANFVKDGGESPIGTSVQSVGTVLNEFGFLGGPTPTALAAMLSGKDSFTGRSILTAGASADQQLMEAMLFTYNMAAPAWLSSHGWFSKMYQAFGKPDTNQFGEVRFTPAQAVSDITGFRPISVMERGGLESRRKEFEFRLKEISTYRSQVIRDRSENSISKASKLKDIAIREKMVRTQMREDLTQ